MYMLNHFAPQLRWTDLGDEVNIGSSVQQQLGDAHVLIVGCNVERRETSLQREKWQNKGENKDNYDLLLSLLKVKTT